MNVVVVESPGKVAAINKYLGPGYKVLASYGHVRDLPSKDGSVRPDEDFAMSWDVDPKAAKRLNDIAEAMKGADRLILATDPDREGEAISWHVLEVLTKKKVIKDKPVERVVFNAITKSAVTEAMKVPRQIDMELVEAYLARRALDYLVGFTLSPVLWRKLPGARSAGRVQSVALRLVVEREMEIEKFKAREYWSVEADVSAGAEPFLARLARHEGRKLDKFTLPYDWQKQIAKDRKPSSSIYIGMYKTEPWENFTGTTHLHEKVYVTRPNDPGLWTQYTADPCVGSPCTSIRQYIGHGVDQLRFDKFRREYQTSVFCL